MVDPEPGVAICFASGVVGAVAVVVFSYVLFGLGISSALGVRPRSLKSPDIYRPLLGRAVGIRSGSSSGPPGSRYTCSAFYTSSRPLLALFLISCPGRRGILRASPGADVHALPAAVICPSDRHRFGCQGDNRQASVNVPTRRTSEDSHLISNLCCLKFTFHADPARNRRRCAGTASLLPATAHAGSGFSTQLLASRS